MGNKIFLINNRGNQIFYNPNPMLDYETLVLKSLEASTYRGFHRVDKSKSGAKEIFINVLINNSSYIKDTLKNAKSEINLDSFLIFELSSSAKSKG